MKVRPILIVLAAILCLAATLVAAVIVLLRTPVLYSVIPRPTPQLCTAMACLNGFTLGLEGGVPADFSVDVSGSDGSQFSTTCHREDGISSGEGCTPGGDVYVEGMTPAQATVTITWDQGSKTEKFTPVYSTYQPNGPNCGPICTGAHIVMTLP